MVTKWVLSENNWEYEGVISITSKETPKQLDSSTLSIDGVKLQFDEEIRFVETVGGES